MERGRKKREDCDIKVDRDGQSVKKWMMRQEESDMSVGWKESAC